jgi:MFS family permease
VYPLLRESMPDTPPDPASERRGRGVRRNVVFLGLTSLFTDISSEMVSAVLPVYVMFYLRLTPLEFGLVDGLYQGVAAIVRVVGGLAADRWRGYKEVAAIGYGLSAVCKLGLLAAGSVWTVLAAVVVLDRTGKGLRTAPRDALISLSSPRAGLATAFGVHRAFDTAGALLGPLVAFGLLALVPNAFDAVFVASFCAAVVGLGVLLLFVENRPPAETAARVPSLRAAVGLLAAPRFRALVIAGAALGLATIGDGFVYLGLQRRLSFAVGFFPLLYVGTALVYLLLAVPAGRLADRVGRERVFVGGYALLLGVYTLLLVPTPGVVELVAVFALLGAYYAATDGVLMALASTVLPASLRTSGLALLTTAIGLARLVAAVAFGALWTWRGVETAVIVYLGALAAAILLTIIALARTAGDHEQASTAATLD